MPSTGRCANVYPRWYTAPEDWPYADVERLYRAAAEENPLLLDEPDALQRFHELRHANSILLLLHREDDGQAVAGMLLQEGDMHVMSCLSVSAALVLPEYRLSHVSRTLHRLYTDLARRAGLNWLCTTTYEGRGRYSTRYKRINNHGKGCR